MIAVLRGTLLTKSPTEVTIDVNGIGFSVNIPLSTYSALGEIAAPVTILTHLHVREDALQLFGFATEDERTMFRLLVSVSGIGPKMAQGILSGIPVRDLRAYIAAGNVGALTTIPGIGRKLAERLVVELREKSAKSDLGSLAPAGVTTEQTKIRSEALLALVSLGYNRAMAEKALRLAMQEGTESTGDVETLIKLALHHVTKS
jgi:Holliday junction DNA helicase RuvA